MRSRMLVLSFVTALGLGALPATARAQRIIVNRTCVRWPCGSSRYVDIEARAERERARAEQRAARDQQRAAKRAEARLYKERGLYTRNYTRDYGRNDLAARIRAQVMASRAIKVRVRRAW